LEFLHRSSEPQRAQSSRKDRRVLKYIFAIFAVKQNGEFQLRNS